MATTDRLYQVRVESLEQIERGRDNLLRCRFDWLGAVQAPSSGTISVYDDAGTAVVSAAAVTISTAGDATYTLLAASTTGRTLGTGWRVEWSITMPDGTTRYPRRDAALVRTRLYPPASIGDVYRRVGVLDPSSPRTITGDLSPEAMDGYLTDAWLDIEGQLLASGRLPWLVLSPQALRRPLILATIAGVYEDLAGRGRAEYATLAKDWRQQAVDAMASVVLTVALDDETPTATEEQAASGALFLCAR